MQETVTESDLLRMPFEEVGYWVEGLTKPEIDHYLEQEWFRKYMVRKLDVLLHPKNPYYPKLKEALRLEETLHAEHRA